jgi:hypothetical protein
LYFIKFLCVAFYDTVLVGVLLVRVFKNVIGGESEVETASGYEEKVIQIRMDWV